MKEEGVNSKAYNNDGGDGDDDEVSLEDIEFPTTIINIQKSSMTNSEPHLLGEWDDDAIMDCFNLGCKRSSGGLNDRCYWDPSKDISVIRNTCATSLNKEEGEEREDDDDDDAKEQDSTQKKIKSSSSPPPVPQQVPLLHCAVDPVYAAIELSGSAIASSRDDENG
mmetsp:Transcript_18541/g.24053  ORF Transcript_18541/g.24053 Transcript_18541/m.24053 type:complete len:166 (-) Transcript_18541:605-1102(-)